MSKLKRVRSHTRMTARGGKPARVRAHISRISRPSGYPQSKIYAKTASYDGGGGM